MQAKRLLPLRRLCFLRFMLLKLQSSLDHPDWIRRCCRHNTCTSSSKKMDSRGLSTTIQMFGNEELAVPVSVEVDRSKSYQVVKE